MQRKRFSKEFKFKVALAAIREDKTLAELSSEYGVNATQISQWKKQFLESGPTLFERGNTTNDKKAQAKEENLYQQIGKLQVEVEWMRKKSVELGLM